MARLQYVNPEGRTDIQQLVAQIEDERGGRLLNLYRMLLHSPPVAGGWLHMGTAVRFETKLDGHSRELAICQVAKLTGAKYEWHHHEPLGLREGVTTEQLRALDNWRESDRFDNRERAILAYAERMTRDIEVDDQTFAAIQAQMEPREVVELTTVIAFYNLVARFLVALRIDIDPA